jgi:hypothetical protein
MTQRKRYRRRALYAALVVGLLAAAIPVSQSLASATQGTTTVPIEKNNSSCDFTGTQKVIGKATITHNKDGSVSGKYSIHGASPTRGYFLFLVSDSISGIPTPPSAIWWRIWGSSRWMRAGTAVRRLQRNNWTLVSAISMCWGSTATRDK